MAGPSVFGKRLREARLKAGLSQKKLAIVAGIEEFSSSPRINQYERGKHCPDYATAERLAKVLNVPAPFLFARDDGLAKVIMMVAKLSDHKIRALLRHIEPPIATRSKSAKPRTKRK